MNEAVLTTKGEAKPAPKKQRLGGTVRNYNANDIPRIIELARKALPTLPNYQGMEVDRVRLGHVLTHNITNPGAFMCLLLCDSHGEIQGGIAAWALPTVFSYDVVCNDIFLWIEPKYRTLYNANLLVNGYVQWGRARNAKKIFGSFTSGLKMVGMDAFLQRLGFVPMGTLYQYGSI